MADRPTTHRRARSITSLMRRQESSGPTVLSILVSAYQVRWRNVEERLATHSFEAAQLDSSGCSVLYRALIRRHDDYPPFPIVRAILRAYPQAIWERTQNMTILEIAIRRMASLETLELLCQARPSIPEDSYAMHVLWQTYVSYFETEDRLVNILLSGTSEAFDIGCKLQLLLRYSTSERLLPCNVHTAAASPHCSLDMLKQFCRTFPLEIGSLSSGHAPLHCALEGVKLSSKTYDEQVAKADYLKGLEPEALVIKSSEGRLPIHLALEARIISPEESTAWIGRDKRTTLKVRDPKTGLCAFQLAASLNASVSTIFVLLRTLPEVIVEHERWEDKDQQKLLSEVLDHDVPEFLSSQLERIFTLTESINWEELQIVLRTPVDPLWHQLIGAAAAFCSPLPLLRMLVAMHQEKLLHEDKRGWLPLHHAVVNPQGDQRGSVRIILEACPQAACHKDKNGLLPLHLAILSGKGTWLLELLLEHSPSAMHQPDGFLGLPPALFAAQCSRGSLSSIYFLLSMSPELFVNSTR